MLFLFIYFVLFNIMKWFFTITDLGLSRPQLGVLQLILMFALLIAVLVITSILSRYIKKDNSV